VTRLAEAVYKREVVTIFGDYDVDGTSSTALLVSTLGALGVPTEWRIPHRESDGYGLSDRGVELVRETSGTLVITVDCGVTALEQIAALTSDGRDVIVLDHHETADSLPDAVAVLDPKRRDCPYPFEGLAAVGVAFKLVQALEDVLGIAPGTLMLPALDLVALGTAADIVPIVDENRVLMRAGLRRLSRKPCVGLAALINVASVNRRNLTTSSIVFGLAPRINAAGRMGSASTAVRLFLATDDAEAFPLAQQLADANRVRQTEDKATLEAAIAEAEEQIGRGVRALVLADASWHPGVVGIVAARLVERYYLPTIMIAMSDPIGRGSGRSIDGFDLHAALGECADVLEGYGGHVKAAGLSITAENVAVFRERFQAVAKRQITDDLLRPKQEIDVVAELGEVSLDTIADIERLGPFGPENRRPVFLSRNVRAAAPPEILKGAHLKVEVYQHGAVREIIGFNMADAAPLFENPVDIAYVPETNTFLGNTRLQLRVKAVRTAEM
ncbi:MAG TPA: single-stranded-DNA-specific exonuclease RecJ, partial [Firmicutes bacterium]|nr:single-stranded-DNA-specific exonuclease RecJ [Bacillota bacterium]